jgi:hypothetical protein
VVVNLGTVTPSGPCCDAPAGTKAFYLGQALNKGLVIPQEQDEVEDRYEVYNLFTNFTLFTGNGAAPVGEARPCSYLGVHIALSYGSGHKQIYNAKGIGRPYNPPPPGMVLRAITVMGVSINDYTEAELREFDSGPIETLVHETHHDVCCYVDFVDPDTGEISNRLLGHQGAHWSMYLNTYGSLLYGCNWRDQGNGEYYATDPTLALRPLDLYLWGLIPPSQVPPMYIVDTLAEPCTPDQETLDALTTDCSNLPLTDFDLCLDPPNTRTYKDNSCTEFECIPYTVETTHNPEDITAIGKKKWVTIDDIIAANGLREPGPNTSPKTTTHLWVLMTGENTGVALDQQTFDRLNRLRWAVGRAMYERTGHRLRIISTFDGTDDTPLWEWGGLPEWEGETELEGWKALELAKPLELKSGQLELHLKGKMSGITHDKLKLDGTRFDGYQVVMTVPLPKDGKPALLHGAFVLKGPKGEKTLRFPIYADGKKKTVTVHPPHKLIKEEACSKTRCVVVCRYSDVEPGSDKKEGWYLSCPGDTGEEPEVLIKAGECRTDDGLNACGPYCTGPATDVTLDPSDPEGWYDSCETRLDDVYDQLALLPVTDDAAAGLRGPVLVDRIDLFRTVEVLEEETHKKDAEKDWDGDGLVNAFDNCPNLANADQIDSNDDKKGDACGDFDADGVENALDNCPTVVNSLQQDDDDDGVGNACDPDYDAGCAMTLGPGRAGLMGLFGLLGLALVGLLLRRRRRGS